MIAAWRQLRLGRQWRMGELPLGVQIVALLLAGVLVAQITTLVLTVLLPPRPAAKYRMVEVARALQGGALKTSNPRPLMRVVRAEPPSLESPDWVISDQSRADLARMVGAPLTDVRILFYSPLPLSRGGGASLVSYRSPVSGDAPGHDQDRPRLIRASIVTFADFQTGQGGPGGGGRSPGGFPGGGFGGVPDRMPAPPSRTQPSPVSTPSISSPSVPIPSVRQSPAQTSSQAQPAPAGDAATTVAPEAHAAQASSGVASSGGGNPQGINAPPSVGVRSGPAPTGIPQGGGQTTPMSSPGTGPVSVPVSGGVSDGPARVWVPPSSTTAPESVVTLPPRVFLHDDLPTPRRREAGESALPETTVAQGDVAHASVEGERAVAPDDVGGFALSPADRGGYVLPSESAPVRGGLGLASTPYLQGDFVAAFQASPGRWVTVQPAPEPFPNTWQRRIMLWFLLSSIVVIPVGLVFARRLAAPLANFAEAAERLGRDPSGAQAPLNGPAEIGRAAHAFNEMQARLRRYIDDRTAMVGAISHDLRTPLARMRFRLERIPPQFHGGMVHDIAQMEEMITSVLAFIRDANEPSVRDRVELRSILECVVDNASLMGGEVTLVPGERVPVDVDSLAIERVLTNLIDNALKYGEKAHVRVFPDGRDVVAEIEDEGPGLPPGELERVFLPFYRSDHSRNLNKTGIGLGLAVSRSIARAHGGDINLSAGQQGLRVQLRLPRASDAALAS